MIEIDHGLKSITRRMAKLDKREVTIGFHGDDHYPDGTNVAQVAIWNEYGTRNAPARPFMRTTGIRYMKDMQRSMARMANAVQMGHQVSFGAMKVLGAEYKDHIQDTLLTGPWAPNAPSTIRKKGHGLPLVDTERMFDSVDYKVT